MFYDVFERLCHEKGVKPSRAADEIGISRATVTNWKKNGYSPRENVMRKVADYFDISVDSLLNTPEMQKAPTLNKKDELLDDDFIVLQRNLQNIPEADRKRIIRNFRDTVDIYLNRLGVENEKEGK